MSSASSKTSFLSRVLGFFTFQKATIKEVTESSSASIQAFFLIILDILITVIFRTFAYSQNQDNSLLGLGALFLKTPTNSSDLSTLLNGFLSALLSTLLLTFFLAIIMAFAANNLGGKVSSMEGIRIIAFSTPILIIGSILIYLTALLNINGIGWLYFVFLIWYILIFFIAFKIGSDLSFVKTFLALLLSIILAIVILEVIFYVLVLFYP